MLSDVPKNKTSSNKLTKNSTISGYTFLYTISDLHILGVTIEEKHSRPHRENQLT